MGVFHDVPDGLKPKRVRQEVPETKVVNIKHAKCDVYIGRPSDWGNPFRIGPDGTREEVLRKFRGWILEQDELIARLPELRGKRLGCYCKPEACHGDILVELLDKIHEPW